jgi:hypothetical protein
VQDQAVSPSGAFTRIGGGASGSRCRPLVLPRAAPVDGPAPNPNPVIVLMDSPLPGRVYDLALPMREHERRRSD